MLKPKDDPGFKCMGALKDVTLLKVQIYKYFLYPICVVFFVFWDLNYIKCDDIFKYIFILYWYKIVTYHTFHIIFEILII